jgi:hypothetical protein
MQQNLRITALLSTVLVAFGCSDLTSPRVASDRSAKDAVAARSPAEQEAALQQVARGVALALGDSRVRLGLRDALRDSPWNEHKLVFHEYLATDGGRHLADAAAAAVGLDHAEFMARVARLPSLDFYFVHGEQRRTWRGTPGVVVGATLDSDAGKEYRFDARGSAVPAPAGRGVPGYPLVALIPAESKGVRLSPQRKGEGDVIEAANDGQEAESFEWIEPNGRVLKANLADIRAGNDPRFTVMMSNVPTNGTRIDCITSTIDDGGAFAGNVELEVYAKFYGPNRVQLGTGVYKNHEFPEPPAGQSVTRCPAVPLVTLVMPDQGTAKINIELWEDDCDCWGNDDDFYGRRDYNWTDRGQLRDVGNDGNMIELDWIPISPSVITSVFVSPVTVHSGSTTWASATPVDQYGYGLPSQPVSSWSSDTPYIAGIDESGTVTGYNTGGTQINATIAGITGSGYVTVENPSCGSMDICPY